MTVHALRFSSFLNRLRLLGVTVVLSPPAPKGSVWLFGKSAGFFPFTKGPMIPMKARNSQDMIPAPMIKKILKHLEIDEPEQSQFWNIQEYDQLSL
jgi:hypothetical protein